MKHKKTAVLLVLLIALAALTWKLSTWLTPQQLQQALQQTGGWAPVLYIGLFVLLPAFFFPVAVLALAGFVRQRGVTGIVLAGIAVNALTQSMLMLMKLTADPEKQLAAIEFWTMGSFADVTMQKLWGVLPLVAAGLLCLFLLNRQIILLGLGEEDARMLGVPVGAMRCAVLLLATLVTGSVVSMTGLISFIGLLAPHIARLLTRSSRFSTTVLAGLAGGALLLAADVLARSIGSSEVPVSIVTSLLGAPFLLHLMFRRGERDA